MKSCLLALTLEEHVIYLSGRLSPLLVSLLIFLKAFSSSAATFCLYQSLTNATISDLTILFKNFSFTSHLSFSSLLNFSIGVVNVSFV